MELRHAGTICTLRSCLRAWTFMLILLIGMSAVLIPQAQTSIAAPLPNTVAQQNCRDVLVTPPLNTGVDDVQWWDQSNRVWQGVQKSQCVRIGDQVRTGPRGRASVTFPGSP